MALRRKCHSLDAPTEPHLILPKPIPIVLVPAQLNQAASSIMLPLQYSTLSTSVEIENSKKDDLQRVPCQRMNLFNSTQENKMKIKKDRNREASQRAREKRKQTFQEMKALNEKLMSENCLLIKEIGHLKSRRLTNNNLKLTNNTLQLTNNDLQQTNNKLQINNDNLQLTNNNLQLTNNNFWLTIKNLQLTNKNLQFKNEHLQLTNANLQLTNSNLQLTNNDLQLTSDTLQIHRITRMQKNTDLEEKLSQP